MSMWAILLTNVSLYPMWPMWAKTLITRDKGYVRLFCQQFIGFRREAHKKTILRHVCYKLMDQMSLINWNGAGDAILIAKEGVTQNFSIDLRSF